MIERLPPQEIAVEHQVVGACLSYGATPKVAEILRSGDDFYDHSDGVIYSVCLGVSGRGEPVDVSTVGAELNRLAILDEAGGLSNLVDLAAGVASGANAEHHARIVLRAARLRAVIEAGSELVERAYRAELSAEELVAAVEDRLAGVLDGSEVKGTARRLDAIMGEVLDDLEYRRQHPGLSGISTGLADLDDLTAGWQRGDLVVIAARPSVGKSGLAFGACLAAAQAGTPTLVYSLEMPGRQVGQRLLSTESGINLHALRTAQLNGEWEAASRTAESLAAVSLYVDDSSSLTVSDIRSRARRLVRQERIGLVAVDYMQLVDGTEAKDNQEREIARISKGLKALAKELDIPVLALSQLSRAPEGRAEHRPQLSDLRYSGSIEQDADLVVMLYRPELYGEKDKAGVAEVIVAKQRNGPRGMVLVQFDAATASFRNLARAEEPPPEARQEYCP